SATSGLRSSKPFASCVSLEWSDFPIAIFGLAILFTFSGGNSFFSRESRTTAAHNCAFQTPVTGHSKTGCYIAEKVCTLPGLGDFLPSRGRYSAIGNGRKRRVCLRVFILL